MNNPYPNIAPCQNSRQAIVRTKMGKHERNSVKYRWLFHQMVIIVRFQRISIFNRSIQKLIGTFPLYGPWDSLVEVGCGSIWIDVYLVLGYGRNACRIHPGFLRQELSDLGTATRDPSIHSI